MDSLSIIHWSKCLLCSHNAHSHILHLNSINYSTLISLIDPPLHTFSTTTQHPAIISSIVLIYLEGFLWIHYLDFCCWYICYLLSSDVIIHRIMWHCGTQLVVCSYIFVWLFLILCWKELDHLLNYFLFYIYVSWPPILQT